jgi:hypothetical protein
MRQVLNHEMVSENSPGLKPREVGVSDPALKRRPNRFRFCNIVSFVVFERPLAVPSSKIVFRR